MKVAEAEDDDDLVTVSTRLVSSLLHQIPNINSFRGKWSIIGAKLSLLQTHLSDFPNPSSKSNPLSFDLLCSVSRTLSDAFLVLNSCLDPSPVQGKLQTQSDIDSVLTRLHRHVADCDVLFQTGVLLQDGVVSGSGSRDSVRAESRNLITRLQIGSSESKISAVDSLLRLIHDEDKNVLIAVAQGVVPALVRLMDSASGETKERAAAAIARVSAVESSRHVLVAEGLPLLNHLLRVLESGSGFAKERACLALQALSASRESARAIGGRGGVASLLEICAAGTPGAQAFAAGVLRNLAGVGEIRENFVEEDAIGVLLGIAASGTVSAQENAIGCLANLVVEDENLKLLIVREGGVECLKNFWDSASAPGSLEVAVELLRHLASCPPISEILVADGFITRLVHVLNCGVLAVRIGAARAVYELGFSSKTRKQIGECGCIAPLIAMLDGKAVEEKEVAAKALSSLLQCPGNRKVFRKDEKAIASAVLLLDPNVHNLDKKYPVSLLALLLHSKKCRKQIVEANACVYLQKLVDLKVEGAKRLLESLGRGKMWGFFSRP